MKKLQKFKISLLVRKHIHIYIYVTRDEYNRCYNSPSFILPDENRKNYDLSRSGEYCAIIPLTRNAYRVFARDRWLNFDVKNIGKDYYNYLMNKYCPTI